MVKILLPLGSPKRYSTKDPKREHNFDNHPFDPGLKRLITQAGMAFAYEALCLSNRAMRWRPRPKHRASLLAAAGVRRLESWL